MKKLIPLHPVEQTGHNCKITAIAAVDQYFGEQLGFEPIPLHKKKTALMSIRQLSKMKGSVQGELLEIRQFTEIFADLGYDTELVDFQENASLFQKTVTNAIKQGNLIVACFPVERSTGLPLTTHSDEKKEHATVLHGFNETTETLEMTHWGEQYTTTIQDFYNASMLLLKQRNPEYYVNIKDKDKNKKYDLHFDQSGQFLPSHYKKSLTPTPNSGFRGKLLVIKQPVLQKILASRFQLISPYLSITGKTLMFLSAILAPIAHMNRISRYRGSFFNIQKYKDAAPYPTNEASSINAFDPMQRTQR